MMSDRGYTALTNSIQGGIGNFQFRSVNIPEMVFYGFLLIASIDPESLEDWLTKAKMRARICPN